MLYWPGFCLARVWGPLLKSVFVEYPKPADLFWVKKWCVNEECLSASNLYSVLNGFVKDLNLSNLLAPKDYFWPADEKSRQSQIRIEEENKERELRRIKDDEERQKRVVKERNLKIQKKKEEEAKLKFEKDEADEKIRQSQS